MHSELLISLSCAGINVNINTSVTSSNAFIEPAGLIQSDSDDPAELRARLQ